MSPNVPIDELSRATDLRVCPASVSEAGGATYFVGRRGDEKVAGCLGSPCLPDAKRTGDLGGRCVCVGPLSAANAVFVRKALPWTAPRCLGLATSAGFGDRLGLSTPGHVRAVRGTGIAPVFAQQSIREMTRTARTPQDVIDAATWGVLQEGFRDGFGADADHLQKPEYLDPTAAAGFTMFTIDPGEHVRSDAGRLGSAELDAAFEAVAREALESSGADLKRRYAGKRFPLDGGSHIEMAEADLGRAAVKYGAAVGHTVRMYRRLADIAGAGAPRGEGVPPLRPEGILPSCFSGSLKRAPEEKQHTEEARGRDARETQGRDPYGQAALATPGPFELEVSVDETDSPTSPAEHYFIAAELRRLGVRWVSLAPRFPGRFEKGIEYIGDLEEFRRSFAQHVAVMRTLGPYKISIHSGSDKFNLYPIIAELCGGMVHLKTAGTTYVEALRAVATAAPDLFRRILSFARSCYDKDRASYLVSAEADRVPDVSSIRDADLPPLLDEPNVRQVLHVTFGSVLTAGGGERFRAPILQALSRHEETFYALLAGHIGRHLRAFRIDK